MIYAVFLRGINTGKVKLLNSDFEQMLHESGAANIKTIQAAGTAVFSCREPELNEFKEAFTHELAVFFQRDIPYLLRTQEQISRVLADELPKRSSSEFHDYIMLTDDPFLFAEIEQAHAPLPFTEGERLINREGYFVWTISKGNTLNEFGSKVLGSKKFRDRLTSRNLNTIEKVAEAMKKITGNE